MRFVLSIDGGGIRGLIPARVLAEIERRTGAPISQHFDLMVGTSSGGILVLGLARPGREDEPEFSAADILQLFETEGPVIFRRPRPFLLRLKRPKYRSDGLTKALKTYFEATALSSSLKPVMVTTYDTQNTDPYFLKSWQPEKSALMWEAAYATSAVPTYFPPLELQGRSLVDGGIYAENPAACALAEARRLWPDQEVVIVSLGTGELRKPRTYEEVRRWGLVKWAGNILDMVFDGSSDTVEYIVRHLLPASNYYRFQGMLPVDTGDKDDASPEHIELLHGVAETILQAHQRSLGHLCDRLRERIETPDVDDRPVA